MTRRVIDCSIYQNSPFTFWTTRAAPDGQGVACAPCASQTVDWQQAAPDEEHLSDGQGVQVGSAGAFTTREYVRSLAINYLLSDREAETVPDCMRYLTRRGWWADSFRSDGFRLGSRLWTLQWEASISETLVRAREYALEALQPLLDYRVAQDISVEARYADRSTIVLDIEIVGPWGPIGLTISGAEHPPYGFLWREIE